MGDFYLKHRWTLVPGRDVARKFLFTKGIAALLINTIGMVRKEVRRVADASFDWLTSDSTSLVEALNVIGLLLGQKPVEDLFTGTSLSMVRSKFTVMLRLLTRPRNSRSLGVSLYLFVLQ